MKTNDRRPYHETFAAAVDAAKETADAIKAVLACPTDLWNIIQEPLFYGQTRSINLELETFAGKPTRRFFHVVIYRMESGRYELTTYVL